MAIPEPVAPPSGPDPLAAPAAEAPAIDPELLGTDVPEPTTPVRPHVPSPVVTSEAGAVARSYDDRFRPIENPPRLYVGARVLFANAGGADKIGGRMGGVQIDLGQTWNSFGYSLTGSAWGGNVLLSDRATTLTTLVGAGPSISLGRRALLGRGFLDLRLGYDFFYAVTNRQFVEGTRVTATSGDVQVEQADNLLPHGPRAQLNMGLLSVDNGSRRFTHGFGVTMGYQGLVGSLRGELPFTHMMTIGLSYWMG